MFGTIFVSKFRRHNGITMRPKCKNIDSRKCQPGHGTYKYFSEFGIYEKYDTKKNKNKSKKRMIIIDWIRNRIDMIVLIFCSEILYKNFLSSLIKIIRLIFLCVVEVNVPTLVKIESNLIELMRENANTLYGESALILQEIGEILDSLRLKKEQDDIIMEEDNVSLYRKDESFQSSQNLDLYNDSAEKEAPKEDNLEDQDENSISNFLFSTITIIKHKKNHQL